MPAPDPSRPLETVAGLIDRVTYFNEENGFAVLRVQVKGRRDLLTVVGMLPAVSAGEWLTAEGQFTQNREHGLQFRAQLAKCVPPNTREGIEKYLGSGLVKGIGPVYAKKLVAHFGEEIFGIIDSFSARLEEVDGIGPGRRRKIKEAWAEQKVIRDIMVFLHAQGVSTSRAVRIYKTYGENAVELVRENPYRLSADIPGVGFKTADQIAQKLGIPKDSIHRTCAGLTHLLGEAAGQGHCALPREILLAKGQELLGASEQLVAEGILQLLLRKELVEEQIGGEDLLFLPALRAAEIGIASILRALASRPAPYPPIDLPKAIEWCQKKTGKELAASQQEALALSLRSSALVITGGPGVGKTTLLNSILLILAAKKIEPILCAPTGRAAKRLSEATGLEAKTIHRLLEFQPGGTGFARKESMPLEGDLVVVDECSMVDVPLMHALLRAHPPGGTLILVGDIDQLPSVGPGSVLKDVIQSEIVPVVRLTEVFRQASQSQIIQNAHRVNRGALPEAPAKGAASDFYFLERDSPEVIVDTVLEMIQERIPPKFHLDPIEDIQLLCPMNRGSIGSRELNLLLQAQLNPPKAGAYQIEKFGWTFRPGDKVMQTENNYDKEVFNGDIGRIVRLDEFEKEAVIRFDKREVAYDFSELDEITLAYAITVHKAQGSEFPAVVMPLAMQHYMLLQRNLLYTGITRGKQLVMLIGEKRAVAAAVRNQETMRRYSGLLSRLRQGSGE